MTSPVPTVTLSPAQEFVSKRLKALRKRITKIDNYPKTDLNEDQLAALAKKPELLAAAKELEDVQKQLVIAEEESAAAEQTRQKEAEEAFDVRVREAVAASEELWAGKIKEVLRIQYVLNVVLANYAASSMSLSEDEYNALIILRSHMFAPVADIATEFYPLMNVQFELLEKLLNKSEETFLESPLTFLDLWRAFEKLTTPSPAVKFGSLELEEEVAPAVIAAPVDIVAPGLDIPVTSVSGSIRFFAANEEQDASATTLLAAETEAPVVAPVESLVKPVVDASVLPEVDVAGAEAAVAALDLDQVRVDWSEDPAPAVVESSEQQPQSEEVVEQPQTEEGGEPKKEFFKKKGFYRGRGRGGFRGRGGPRPFYPRDNNNKEHNGEYQKNSYHQRNNGGPQVDSEGFILAGSHKPHYRGRGRGSGFRGGPRRPFNKDNAPAPAGSVAPAHS